MAVTCTCYTSEKGLDLQPGPAHRDRANFEVNTPNARVIGSLQQGLLHLGYAQRRCKTAALLLCHITIDLYDKTRNVEHSALY